MKIKNIILFFSIFFISLFAVYKINFHGPDQPIYLAYTTSIVEDGDLNVVNNGYSKHSVSKTYNLPDFHNHGGVVLWAPFYSYGKHIYSILSKLKPTFFSRYSLDSFIKCTMAFSTIVFGFFTVLLTFFLCRLFFSNDISLWSTLVIFFGTPFFYYTLSETGNANIIGSLLSIISIWFCSYAVYMRRPHWFLYGLFFSICIVVKIDLWFQIIFILSFFIVLLILRQVNWISLIYFLIGFTLGIALKTINDYVKYGVFHTGELGLLNFRNYYLFEQLFSSYHGFFYTSPIFYFCLLGFIFLIINLLRDIKTINDKKMQDIFLFILSLYLLTKIFIIPFSYAWGGGTVGARALLTEFPVFVLLYARVFQGRGTYFEDIINIISIVFIFRNLLITSEFIAAVDIRYITGAPPLNLRVETIKYIYNLFYIKDLYFKLVLCLPLLFATFVVTHYLIGRIKTIDPVFWYIRKDCGSFLRLLSLFTVYLCIAYTIVTSLNITNNKKNVEGLIREGFFKNVEIINSREFEKRENIGSMNEMIKYFELKGNIDKVNKIKKYKKEIYGENG